MILSTLLIYRYVDCQQFSSLVCLLFHCMHFMYNYWQTKMSHGVPVRDWIVYR